MISEIGNFLLAMAFGFVSVQILSSLWGVLGSPGGKPNHPSNKYLSLGRMTTFLQGGFLGAAFLTLLTAFLTGDFSIASVAFHTHTTLPWYYRLAATWGNHEGSFFLFILVLSGMGMAFATFLSPSPFRARALVIQGLLTGLFLGFLYLSSNPFQALPFSLPEGNSLNPLLQDQGLFIHPPLLYLGYVGFSAPFSLAIAALWGNEDVATWTTLVRPWVLGAWGALTAGITLGSWWAYYELGWGGWWFWDPVENASLMPWLSSTALLHTLRTQKLYRWSLFLCLLTFGLSLLGTFLVRSGLITSVHSFVQDPERGVLILSLLGGIMGFSFLLWIWKAPHMKSHPLLIFSREGALLLNSLFLSLGLSIVILGTLYPLLTSEPIAIGTPYFERTFVPLLLPFILLIPIGSLLKEQNDALFSYLLAPFTVTLGSIVLILYFFYPLSLWAFAGIAAAIWVLGGTLMAYRKNRLSFGPTLAHLGVAISLLGVSVGGGFRIDKTHILRPQESLMIAGEKLTLQKVYQGKGTNYLYEQAILTFSGKVLTPEKRLYYPQNSLLSETAISTNGLRDLYVILGSYQGENRWLIRASWIPLAPWIWIGGAFMVLGSLFSLFRFTTQRGRFQVVEQAQRYFWIPLVKGKLQRILLSLMMIFIIFPVRANDLEKRAAALNQEIRCPVCLAQSIADSETDASLSLKAFIFKELKEGTPEEAIREKIRVLYGNGIFFRPAFNTSTAFLWLLPFFFFLVILVIFLRKGIKAYKK